MFYFDIQKYKHMQFYVFFSLLLISIFVRYALQINIPKSIFLVFIFLIVTFGDKTEILTMCICCIPLHSTIDFYYAIVICITLYVLKFYKTFRIKPVFLLILFMIAWELLHGLTHGIEIIQLISIFIPIIALAVIMCTDVLDYDYAFVVRMLAITTVAIGTTLMSKVLYFSNFDFATAFIRLQRLGLDSVDVAENVLVSGGEINPNTLGIICVLASTALFQLFATKDGKKSDLLLIGILLIFGALTSSRTFLVCMALMILLFLFGQKGSFLEKLRFCFLCILTLFCIALILKIAFPGQMAYLLGRFQTSDLSNGRVDLMTNYHNFIFSNIEILFYGVGYQNFSRKLLDVYKVSVGVPHNSVQEIIVGWGIPGLVMIVILLGMMILYSKRYAKKRNLLSFIPLLIILAKSMAGQLLTSSYTMLAFSFAYLSLCQNFDSTKTTDSSDIDLKL